MPGNMNNKNANLVGKEEDYLTRLLHKFLEINVKIPNGQKY